eukprot:195627_1
MGAIDYGLKHDAKGIFINLTNSEFYFDNNTHYLNGDWFGHFFIPYIPLKPNGKNLNITTMYDIPKDDLISCDSYFSWHGWWMSFGSVPNSNRSYQKYIVNNYLKFKQSKAINILNDVHSYKMNMTNNDNSTFIIGIHVRLGDKIHKGATSSNVKYKILLNDLFGMHKG